MEDFAEIGEANRRASGGGQGARPVEASREGGRVGSFLVAVEDGRSVGHVMLGGAAILVGRPGYCPRSGLPAVPAENLPSAYRGEASVALEPGALSGVSGRFEFAPAFGAVS